MVRSVTHRERVQDWCCRNWLLAILILQLVIAFVFVFPGLALYSEFQRREAQRQRQQAEQSFRLARQAVDNHLTLAERDLADGADVEGVRRQLLEGALDHYRSFLQENTNDPARKDELAQAHFRIAKLSAQLGRKDEALAALRQAVAHGFRDTEALKKDPDLEALRSRKEFRKLLTELEPRP